MDKLEAQTIDRSVATEVANRAGVKTMMLSSIIHLGNKMRITSQFIYVQSGSVIGSPQADGVKVEDVVSMVDDLTEQVSTTLELAEKYSRKASRKERLFILAIQAAMNRDFQKAESLLVDYVNRYPMGKNVAIELYIIARINGNVERQIWAIERILESDPAFAQAYNILAYIYAAQNEHAKAISANKKYRALEPDIINPYYTAGEIYIQAGQLDAALRISEQALQKNPQWIRLYPHIGHIYLYQGKGEKARDYHLLLAEIHLAQGDGQAALTALDNYNIAALYSSRFRTLKAASHALLGHYEEAIKQYKEFYNFVPARYNAMGGDRVDYYYGRSRVPYDLASIYEQMGDTAKAVEYYSKTLDQWKNADADLPELLDAKARLVQLTDVSNKCSQNRVSLSEQTTVFIRYIEI